MAVHFRFVSTSSIPERKDVTEDIERRIRLQEEAKAADRAVRLPQAQTSPEPATSRP